VVVDAVRDDLGVGLRGELVALALGLVAKLLVVLDDAVVDDRDAVLRDVRVRVSLARYAVRGPAGVCDAEAPVRRIGVERVLGFFTLPTVRRRLIVPAPFSTATPAES
jgi:hypothetical protein